MNLKDELYTNDAFGRNADPKAINFDEEKLPPPITYQRPYEKFFEGYTMKQIPQKGRMRFIRTYTGIFYHQELTATQAKKRRWSYSLVFAISCILFLAALILPVKSNSYWYIMPFSLITAVFYGRVLLALHTYVWSKPNLTIYEYKHGALALPKRSLVAAVSIILPIVSAIAALRWENASVGLGEVIRLILLLFSAALLFFLGVQENKLEYTILEQPPE